MTPSELFKPYTGMTVEGSTEKEREEIVTLLQQKGIAPTTKWFAVKSGFCFSPNLNRFMALHTHIKIENIPYTEFKQLIEKL